MRGHKDGLWTILSWFIWNAKFLLQKNSSGKYDKLDAEKLFELAKKGRYPSFLAELAESFGMMLVKIEAREFRLKQTIEELEETKAKLEK